MTWSVWAWEGAGLAQGFPLQLEIEVPFAAAPFPSAGETHLVYEIYLRNFGGAPLTLERLDVVDADNSETPPLASLAGDELVALVRPVGRRPTDNADALTLPAGGSAIVFMSVVLDDAAEVTALRHRVLTGAGEMLSAPAVLASADIPSFAPPVRGDGWRLSGGPDNASGHRRGMIAYEGLAQISRRYAMDWMQVEDGATFAGDARDNASYFAYDEPVLAVADGVVVAARDGFPENIPGERAVEMQLDSIPGNFVTLDIGNGLFARYMHLKPGSLRVEQGDSVRRGDVIGALGNSGDSSEPHLHFEVTTAPAMLGGEGVPYVLEEFRTVGADGVERLHAEELPMPADDMTVNIRAD